MIIDLQKTIWAVINDLDSKESIEEVKFGFVGYGRKAFGEDNNFSKVLQDLNSDINEIGYLLLKSQTLIQGCDAYPQKALNDCIEGISWSKEENVKKMVVLIGNGGIPHAQMAKQLKKAYKDNIKVVPVYYNSRNRNGEIKEWENFAKACQSDFLITTPVSNNIVFTKSYDENFLLQSGDRLLSTYIPYNVEGKRELKKLEFIYAQSKENSVDNYEEMLIYQSSYHVQGSKSNWDLVDLATRGAIDFDQIEKEQLPDYLQSFTNDQLSRYIALKVNERKLLIKKIRLELSKRQAFVNKRQIKSKHLVGGGGLSNILQLFFISQFEEMPLATSAESK